MIQRYNEGYEDDSPIKDDSDDKMSRYDTDVSTVSDENSNDENDSVFENQL